MYRCRHALWVAVFGWLWLPWVELGIASRQFAIAQTPPASNRELPDRKLDADRLLEVGNQQFLQGQWRQALATFQQVLAIRQALGDRVNEGRTLTAIGRVYHNLGDYPSALTALQSALEINRALADLQGEGVTLNELAIVHRKRSRYDDAIALHQQALTASRECSPAGGRSAQPGADAERSRCHLQQSREI